MQRVTRIGPSYYDLYLASADWKAKRWQRIAIDGERCTRCGSEEELHVHHLSYDRLGDESMDDLRTLCKTCHQKEHGRDPVVSLPDAFHRGQVSGEEHWAHSVRVRAARAQKELEGLFEKLAWCEPDPRIDQVRDLMAGIMQTFEEWHAEDAHNLACGAVA